MVHTHRLVSATDLDEMKANGRTIIVHMKKAYDLTNWKDLHPGTRIIICIISRLATLFMIVYLRSLTHWHSGGSLVLENLAGTDCTDQILVYHPSGAIAKYLTYFYLGDVDYKDDSQVMCSLTLNICPH